MNNLDYIESYFAHVPDPSSIKEFENRIESDQAFAEEVAFYLSAIAVSKENAQLETKKRFHSIYRENLAAGSSPDNPSAGPSPLYKAARITPVRKLITSLTAAAVVAGLVFGIYMYSNNEPPREMADRYVKEHLTTLGVTMSSRTDSIQSGLQLYNEGKTAEALQHFELILQSDSSNFTATEYAGLAALRQKDYEKALSYFGRMEKKTSLYANPAMFYKAVTLMQRNQHDDAAKANQILKSIVQNDLEGKEVAQEWLRKW